MPNFTSVDAWGREVDNLARSLQRELTQATREMAENARKVALTEARSDLGGDTQFSGWPTRDLADLVVKRGRRKGVNDMSHWMFPTRKSGGPWKVAEQGRNQGDVRGRGGSLVFSGPLVNRGTGETNERTLQRLANAAAKGRILNTGGRRRKTKWSGYTKGKRTASNAADRFDRDSERIAEQKFRTALKKHFDVT